MILVVDDHQEFRRIIRQILELESDLAVSGEAENGEAAVEHVRHHQPALVLMDVAMPRLDGFEATRQIKAMRPDTKVLILTVHTQEGYQERARESGADAYLPKQEAVTREPLDFVSLSANHPACPTARGTSSLTVHPATPMRRDSATDPPWTRPGTRAGTRSAPVERMAPGCARVRARVRGAGRGRVDCVSAARGAPRSGQVG